MAEIKLTGPGPDGSDGPDGPDGPGGPHGPDGPDPPPIFSQRNCYLQ